jgi:hypothetical protein
MKLTEKETRFLTALAREQNQTGCRGPAHELLRQHAYPSAPRTGQGSLAFSYDAVPLIGIILREFTDLQVIDDFLCRGELCSDPEWPWASAEEYHGRLAAARGELASRETVASPNVRNDSSVFST